MNNYSRKFCFGILCPPLMGHLYPMLSLALEIKRRGHRVVLFYYSMNVYPVLFRQGYFSTLVSKIATISQQPEEFDFPRSNLPQNFHFTGPFVDPHSRENVDFPWHKLNGKPVVYSSIGTLQNSNNNIFEKIAAACIDLDCQLVISLGEKNKTTLIRQLPNDAIVVPYAPQLTLLRQASLCITHAGMNTTLEALSNGVPLVAIPIANDQPAVSARINWTKTGRVVKYDCKVTHLKEAISKVLNEDMYRQNALKIQNKIQASSGVNNAANFIEKVLLSSG